jgi:Zn-finger nucleic acid-binding protein
MQDTLFKTIAVSILSVFTGLGAIVHGLLRSSKGSCTSRRGKGGGAMILLLWVLYLVLLVIRFLTFLVGMFISRQCEYRADAVAVRLSRDPLSLARALRKISVGWRGGGDVYDSFESLFIMSPNFSHLDEREGFFSNLFSTHPPAMRRIGTLLDMGHVDFNALENSIKETVSARPVVPQISRIDEPRWMAVLDGQWKGPFLAQELVGMGLCSDTFVRREGMEKMSIVATDPELLKYFHERKGAKGTSGCPHCFKALDSVVYEGVAIGYCSACGGFWIPENKLTRILVRREQGFDDDLVREAKLVMEKSQAMFLSKPKLQHELSCPECGEKMVRHLYSYVYPVEVDSCYSCRATWYDKRELEILQYLVENAAV